jgi:phenylpyruvate tautomerase PptA (4-oxalocrotonate tautomerase family)
MPTCRVDCSPGAQISNTAKSQFVQDATDVVARCASTPRAFVHIVLNECSHVTWGGVESCDVVHMHVLTASSQLDHSSGSQVGSHAFERSVTDISI